MSLKATETFCQMKCPATTQSIKTVLIKVNAGGDASLDRFGATSDQVASQTSLGGFVH